MNRQEAILLSAYTGYMLLPSGEFGYVHEKIEKALGRPVWTHELAQKEVHERIKVALLPELKILLDNIIDMTPDPDTGLVKCGCGGKAVYEEFFDGFFNIDRVTCETCGIKVDTAEARQAKSAWNTAMGWKGEIR